MILVDSSGSIYDADRHANPSNWELVTGLVRLLLDVINEDSEIGVTSRIAIYTYSNIVVQHINFTQGLNHQQIVRYLDDGRMTFIGSFTHMYEAVTIARDYLQQSARRVSGEISATQAIILFTDGIPCANGRKYEMSSFWQNLCILP